MGLQRNKGCIVAVIFRKTHSFIHLLIHFYLAYALSPTVHAGESVISKIDMLCPHGVYKLIEIDRSSFISALLTMKIQKKQRLFIQSLL